MVTGVWDIKERLEGVVSQYYHRPFIKRDDYMRLGFWILRGAVYIFLMYCFVFLCLLTVRTEFTIDTCSDMLCF